MKNNSEKIQNWFTKCTKVLSDFVNKHIENIFLWGWVVLLLFSIVSISFIYCTEKELDISLTTEGFSTFFTIFAGPVKFLAGFLAILAAWLTLRRIRQTQEQLDLTRENIENQTNQIYNNSFSLLIHSFETLFARFQECKTQIKSGDKINEIYGSGSLFYWLKNEYDKLKLSNPRIDETELIKRSYNSFYNNCHIFYSHFYETLIKYIKIIEYSKIPNMEFYITIILSRFFGYDIILLFYHYISDESSDEFKYYIEKYNFLKNLDRGKLIKPEHAGLYIQNKIK
jgi:hypothetical protein